MIKITTVKHWLSSGYYDVSWTNGKESATMRVSKEDAETLIEFNEFKGMILTNGDNAESYFIPEK